jgi:hypothetical protein
VNDDIIQHLYADYRLWCRALGIPPERWEDFYNTIKNHGLGLNEMLEMNLSTGLIPSGVIDEIRNDLEASRPINSGDEARAVDEVIRMLGGE